jgi:hypothetical protein
MQGTPLNNGTCINANSSITQYAGHIPYDIDLNQIQSFRQSKWSINAVDTFLLTDLNPGDLVINVVNTSGWKNTSGNDYQRHLAFYNYTNSKGYTYPNWTYTRNY